MSNILQMKTGIQLLLPFLGERQYLHGTTLFEALCILLPSDSGVNFKFSRVITTNLVKVSWVSSIEEPSATFSFELDGQSRKVGVYPVALMKLKRIAYLEDLVTERAYFAGESVQLSKASPYGFVSTLIPLNKMLLKHYIVMSDSFQWLFTRLDLWKIPESVNPLNLKIESVSQGGKSVKTAVYQGEERLGDLFFSMAEKDSKHVK